MIARHLLKTGLQKNLRPEFVANFAILRTLSILPTPVSRRYTSTGTADNNNRLYPDVPGVKTGGDKMVMMYTCKVCDTRSVKQISKQGYNHGVVIVRCACCNSKHLIADKMGVFEDAGWNIHDYLSSKEGENSKFVVEDDVFELNLQDIVGTKGIKQN